MNAIKLKKNSWHYKLIKKFGHHKPELYTDFCSYFWAVIFSSIWTTVLITIAVSIFYVSVIAPLMYLVVCLQYGWFQIPQEVALGIGIDLALMIIIIASITGYYINEYKHKQLEKDNEYFNIHGHFPERTQWFLSLAWKKFKDKTCHKIEFN